MGGVCGAPSSAPFALEPAETVEPIPACPLSFSFHLPQDVVCFRTKSSRDEKDGSELDPAQRLDAISPDDIVGAKFAIKMKLGDGASGRVLLLESKETGQLYTLKLISKGHARGQEIFSNEVKILSRLSQVYPLDPSIIQLTSAFETPEYYQIMTPFYAGEDIITAGLDQGSGILDESFWMHVFWQVFKCLELLHSQHIVHRDVKPENFLVSCKKGFWKEDHALQVTIIDVGGSAMLENDDSLIADIAGSCHFVAPELLSKSYENKRTCALWKKCDAWSTGVMLFLCLYGKLPFDGRTQIGIFQKVKSGVFYIEGQSPVSKEAHDLVTKLLTVDSKARLSASQALQHKWFGSKRNDNIDKNMRNSKQKFPVISGDIYDRLKEYRDNLHSKLNRDLKKLRSKEQQAMTDKVIESNANNSTPNTAITPGLLTSTPTSAM